MSLSLGGGVNTAEARASEGQAQTLGSAALESASATWLCSDGRWPTTNRHRRRACLHDNSRATANIEPRPFSERALSRAPVLSPRTATGVSVNRSPHTHRARSRVANSQNVWCDESSMTTPRCGASSPIQIVEKYSTIAPFGSRRRAPPP